MIGINRRSLLKDGLASRCWLQRVTHTGFTLIELLVSMAVFTVVLITTSSLLSVSLRELRFAESRMGQFQEAQSAFESMSRRLVGCELNPYYGFVYPNNDTTKVPTQFALQSELHFICGPCNTGTQPLFASGSLPPRPTHGLFFHGTYGLTDNTSWKAMSNLLNSWGYYLEFGTDGTDRAAFLKTDTVVAERYRFRLKELQVSAEQLRTYKIDINKIGITASDVFKWFRDTAAATPSAGRTIAENIVALVITPLKSDPVTGTNVDLSPDYYYDSRAYQYTALSQTRLDQMRHRIPPLVRITMVGLDEPSASRLADVSKTTAPDLSLATLFADASKYDDDLTTLKNTLQGKKLNYRVFTTTVRLRNSRWTGSY